ncbi:ribose import permease protein RbsC-like [Saccostrea echinata]|uniref:ribose import permease protein RbsC-like n=1 Tax=Saccostrea echinata TaxID=191078 RepID=UPI002A835D41|nr:ribose import permease protein RbsC-like [Saccostrea echinata]
MKKLRIFWTGFQEKYSIILILLLLIIISSIINPNFLSPANLANVSRQVSVTVILAFGATILIVCGLIDLSCGSVLALSGLLSVSVYKMTGSLVLAFPVAVLAGVMANLLSAVMVTKYRVPSFIATLAMLAMARGAALLYTRGQNIYQIEGYTVLGQGSILGIPTPLIFLLIFLMITWYILQHTKLGRSFFAIGGNENAAIASGIHTDSCKIWAFVLNGFFVGVAGVLFMSRVNAGLPNAGIGYELHALTAAIIGGTSFSGGIGTAGGTAAGAFIVGFLNNIMNLANVNSYLQQVVRGLIIALAVIYDMRARSKRETGS